MPSSVIINIEFNYGHDQGNVVDLHDLLQFNHRPTRNLYISLMLTTFQVILLQGSTLSTGNSLPSYLMLIAASGIAFTETNREYELDYNYFEFIGLAHIQIQRGFYVGFT